MNKHLKIKAIELRKLGKSYNEINSELKIPQSTLSNWFSKMSWSNEVKIKLIKLTEKSHAERLVKMNDARRKVLDESYVKARIEAKNEFEKYKNDPFFMFGLALYWGEGDKKSQSHLRITNSDAELIRIFKTFIEKYCDGKNKHIWAGLLIYPDLEAQKCIHYWSEKINLDKKLFQKCVVIEGKSRRDKLQYGICILGISSRFLKEKMLEWLRLIQFYKPN